MKLLQALTGVIVCAVSLLQSPGALAQTLSPSIEVGGGLNRYDTQRSLSGAWVAPALRVSAGPASVSAVGRFTGFDLDLLASRYDLGFHLTPALTGCFRLHASLEGERDLLPEFGAFDRRTASAGVSCAASAAEWKLTGTGSRYSSPTDASRRALDVQLSGQFRLARGALQLVLGSSAVEGRPAVYRDSVAPLNDTSVAVLKVLERAAQPTRSFLTAGAAGDWQVGVLRVGGELGARLGSSGQHSAWGSMSAEVPVGDQLTLRGSYGISPVHPASHLRATPEAQISVRWRPAPAPQPEPPTLDRPLPAPLSVSRLDGEFILLTLYVAGARKVEITGDFANWVPIPMSAGYEAAWQATLPLPPGTHRVNVRIDGGPWLPPPGAPAVADEFGGQVGLLTIG